MVADELAVIGANCIQKQANADAEAIDEHILFADVGHPLPQCLVRLVHPLSFLRQTGSNRHAEFRCLVANLAVFTSVSDTGFVG